MLPSYRYRATVLRVIDGDTYDMDVDLGFRIRLKIRVRLAGADTAELNDPDLGQRMRAVDARRYCQDNLEGKMVIIESIKTSAYNRWEARVAFVDETGTWRDLSSRLIDNGLAETWVKR